MQCEQAPSQAEQTVAELRIQMAEAAAPEALRHHPAWCVVLHFAIEMLNAEQRQRLGRLIDRLERAAVR